MKDLIKIVQLPVIEQKLKSLKAEITKEVDRALKMPCTFENVKEVKKTRADLKKDFEMLEAQRKEVKRKIAEPYEAFEQIYKTYVSEIYKNADNTLKERIDGIENEMIADKTKNVLPYFHEVCEFSKIQFLSFEDLAIKITKSTTEKAIKESILSKISVIENDLRLIENLDDEISATAKAFYIDRQSGTFLDAVNSVESAKRLIEITKTDFKNEDCLQTKNEEKALQKVEQAILHAPTEESEELKMTFTVFGTKLQFLTIKEFLEKEGIKYE